MGGGASPSRKDPMTISLVVAMDEGGLIGRDGQLPWRLPEDLKHFKRLTVGKTVLMGRKTWDSLGKPLPDRENWVVTRNAGFRPAGARVFDSLEAALAAPRATDLMAIGGEAVFRAALPRARRLYLTRVHATVEGDVYFPAFDAAQFREVERDDRPADDRHAHPYSFITLERR